MEEYNIDCSESPEQINKISYQSSLVKFKTKEFHHGEDAHVEPWSSRFDFKESSDSEIEDSDILQNIQEFSSPVEEMKIINKKSFRSSTLKHSRAKKSLHSVLSKSISLKRKSIVGIDHLKIKKAIHSAHDLESSKNTALTAIRKDVDCEDIKISPISSNQSQFNTCNTSSNHFLESQNTKDIIQSPLNSIDDIFEIESSLTQEKSSHNDSQNINCSLSQDISSCETKTKTSKILLEKAFFDSYSSDEIHSEPSDSEKELKLGSRWIQNLKTPKKFTSNSTNHGRGYVKKSKLSRGGYAEQLQKLQRNLKSSINMRKHQLMNQKCGETKTCIEFNVEKIARHYSNVVLEGKTLNEDQIKCNENAIVLSFELEESCKYITVGCVLKIFPPWQKIAWSNNKTVLLASHFSFMHEVTENPRQNSSSSCDEWKLVYKFECSCFDDDLSTPNSCNQHEPLNLVSMSSTPYCSNNLPALTSNNAETIKNPLNILEVIDTHNAMKLVNFKAYVLKRYLHHKNSMHTELIVVEDLNGTIAVIEATSEASLFNSSLQIGHFYNFNKLKISDRCTPSRNPTLFSLLGQFCILNEIPCPAYCYIFFTSVHSEVKQNTKKKAKEIKIESKSSLHEIKFNGGKEERFHIIVKLCYIESKNWYITDQSVKCLPIRLLIVPEFSINDRISSIIVKNNPNMIIEILDVKKINDNTLKADCYSQLIGPLVAKQRDDLLILKPESLTLNSIEKQIYIVEGSICDIDEPSAISSLICDTCSENLQEDKKIFHCKRCEKSVQNPIEKLELDVFIQTLHISSENTIVIKLLHRTISSLLKYKSSNNLYNMDDLLNKSIGPVAVILEKVSVISGNFKMWLNEIDLKEG